MKKLLLIVLLMGFLVANAQYDRNNARKASPHMPAIVYTDNGGSYAASMNKLLESPSTATPFNGNRDVNFVNPFQIGSAGNAFGFAFNRTTYLWADNNINTVAFMHRMTAAPGTGYLAYDISKDGGAAGTWTNNVQTYSAAAPNPGARYPQGAIFNPPGNSDPDNAYYHYFAPTLDGSNTSGTLTWGGYAFGVKNLASGSTPTQHNQPSADPFWQFLPSAFTVTQMGDAWMADECTKGIGGDDYEYQGSIILGHGIWNPDVNDFDYTFDLFPLDINPDDGFNDMKVAFAPDGQTGYLCFMTELPEKLDYTSYHPVLFKTTNGGESWSDPIEVQLGGTYGIDAVKYYISDERLEGFYGAQTPPQEVPPRDEIMYFMGYEVDMSVDAWGNPHLIGLVTLADTGGIYVSDGQSIPGLSAIFHIWSDDQGETWDGFNLAYINEWDRTFTSSAGNVVQYNRPQAATTMDGQIVFFSWLDTEDTTATDNSKPDIYFRDYLPARNFHSEDSINVTYFSGGMWNSYFGCMSHYVFSDITFGDEIVYDCTIPFVYENMTNNDPSLEVKFFYIPDFTQTYVVSGVGVPENKNALSMEVYQNYPNPFRTASAIRVYLPAASDLKLVVTDMLGKQVMEINKGEVAAGSHQFLVDGSRLGNGIYFYTVTAGTESVTKKMIVR